MIPCFVITYFDPKTIQKTLDFLSKESRLRIHVVENKSETSSENLEYCLSLLKKELINSYSLMKTNISNNAFEMMFHHHDKEIVNSNYVLISDGDLVVSDPHWLDEQLNLLEKNSEIFACGVRLSLENLPVATFPDAIHWIPPCIKETSTYYEQLTGIHLLLLRSKDFKLFLNTMVEKGSPFLDSLMHDFCYRVLNKKWAMTKNASAYHITWDHYQDLNHPYVKAKLNKPLHRVWNHRRYCSYKFYQKNGGAVIVTNVRFPSIILYTRRVFNYATTLLKKIKKICSL